MHHKCTARHIKRARLARGSLDSADFAISFVCEERYPVTIAVGRHLFPSRTQQLSPPAPMVLPWQRGGRVGRCRVSLFLSSASRRSCGRLTWHARDRLESCDLENAILVDGVLGQQRLHERVELRSVFAQ